MKDILVDKLLFMIKDNNNSYNELELEKIRYGLEGLYLMITKLIIIFILALILDIVKETLLLFVIFSGLRFFGFGVHAKTSFQCLIYSTLLFIVLPYIFYNIEINLITEIIIFTICFINLLIFAPSDSENRRFKKKRKYLIRKFLTLVVTVIYMWLYFNTDYLNVLFMISIIIQSIVVNPLIYKLLGVDYNYNFLGLNRNI